MLRLAHRILHQGLYKTDNHLLPDKEHCTIGQMISRCIGESTVVVADNVNDYVQNIGVSARLYEDDYTDGVKALEQKDIPCMLPPWNNLFIEWITGDEPAAVAAGVKQCGMLFLTTPAEESVSTGISYRDYFEEQKDPLAFVMAYYVYCDCRGNAVYDGNYWAYFCNSRGGLASDDTRRIRGTDMLAPPAATPLMTISLMHCKNVVKRDATYEHGPDAKWLRLQKQPDIRYHVLDINPMKEVLRTEGGIETNGLKKALHICRGHFATYTDEKRLFGKHKGTFWVPSHVRGSVEHGIVDKDYRVKAPVPQTQPPK